MKQVFFLSILFLSSFGIKAEGIEFFKGEWKEALELAAQEEKLIFVDAYTTWCGPCKKMSKAVFPDGEVGEFYNENFVSLKIDMEKPMGREFGSKYPVTAYPTLIFINSEGKMIHKAVGYRAPDKFIAEGEKAIKKDDKSIGLEQKYLDGDRSYDFILKYVKALNRAGKPSMKVSNDYLISKPDITKEQKALFLFEAAQECDSRLFTKLMEHRSFLKGVKTDEDMDAKIASACNATIKKAIEYESEKLFEEAIESAKNNLSNDKEKYISTAKIQYFEGTGEIDKFFKEVEKFSKKYISDEEDELVELSYQLIQKYKKNKKGSDLAESIAARATKKSTSSETWLNYSRILLYNKKKAEALETAQKAKTLAEEAGRNTSQIDNYIKYIEAS